MMDEDLANLLGIAVGCLILLIVTPIMERRKNRRKLITRKDHPFGSGAPAIHEGDVCPVITFRAPTNTYGEPNDQR